MWHRRQCGFKRICRRALEHFSPTCQDAASPSALRLREAPAGPASASMLVCTLREQRKVHLPLVGMKMGCSVTSTTPHTHTSTA